MTKPIKFAITLVFSSLAHAQAPVPKDGFVPDEATAIRIVEAILPPICHCAAHNRPFTAVLDKGTWTVTGKRPKDPSVRGGGEVEVHVDQHTGEIISYVFIE